MSNVKLHLDMLEACKQSTKCKKFIPSEWGANVADFPDQPAFYYENHEPIRQALRDQNEVQWTLVINNWFMEYVVPLKNRYFKSAGEVWPMDDEKKVFTIYGNGTTAVDFTSARDVGKALAELVKHDQWEPYTYLAGMNTTWNGLFEIAKGRDSAWQRKPRSLVQSIQQIIEAKSEWDSIVGWFEVYSNTAATSSPAERVNAHRKKYFSDIKFTGIEEMMDAAVANPEKVL